MSQPFNISMSIRADASQAKSALTDFNRTVQQTGAESGKVKSALDAEAAALDKVASVAQRAARAKSSLTVVNTAAMQDQALTRAIQQTAGTTRLLETELRSVSSAAVAAGTALQTGFADAAREAVEAAAEARQFRAALDDIRASYNPLFAVSRQYEQELDRISEAERLGAISAREAATARKQAAARLAPVGAAGAPGQLQRGAGAWITGNLAAQGNDIMMMAMAGQNPLQLALQQGTQVSQVLNGLDKGISITGALKAGFISMINPISLATIGVIALGAGIVQLATSALPKTKTFAETMTTLRTATDAYAESSKRARLGTADLQAEFGSASGMARKLLADIAELDRISAARAASDAVKALPKALGLAEIRSGGQAGQAQEGMGRGLYSQFGLRWDDEGNALVGRVQSAIGKMNGAKGLDAQIAAVTELQKAYWDAANAAGGITKEEEAQLRAIAEALDLLGKQKGLQENAAGTAAAKQMADDFGRQAAMAAKVAQFGQDSAAVRLLELQQQRQITAEKLESLGIDAKAPEYQRIMNALQVTHDKREQSIRDGRARAHNEQLAALTLEGQLIGATTAERLRAKAVAEAVADADRNSLAPWERMLEIMRAIARASVEAANERKKAAYDLQTTQMTDALDAQIGMARDPLTKAGLEGERERIRLLRDGVNADDAAARAAAVRARSLTEAINQQRGQIATMSDEVSVRQQVAAQVASGTLLASEANAAIQRELALRPLVAAAARAEGTEKAALTDIITGLRIAYEAQALENRRQAQNEYLRGTAERIQQARLELALIGQTAAVRARVVALVQAERDIRAQGLTGTYADDTRRKAEELAGLNMQIEAQGDAWRRVQSAGESAIDAVLDKLKGGDLKGAFAGLLDELNKGFFDLAVKNPLKNMILGTNLGTLDDVGGLSGIWGRLTGKTPLDQKSVIGAASAQVQAMQIAATQVTITAATLGLGGGAAGLLAGLPGAMSGIANVNAAPIPAGLDIQSVLSGVAVGGGARGGAIAGLDRALAEPLAAMVSEAQRLFGDSAVKINSAYRSAERQAQLWQAALQKYGSAEAARKWVAPPGRSNHGRGMAADLGYGSPDVQRWFQQNAGRYGLTYRMPNEPWHIEPAGGRGTAQGRIGQDAVAAQQALAGLGSTAQMVTTPIGQMGSTAQQATGRMGEMSAGLGQIGGALQQILGAAVSGNKGGAVGGLLNLGIGLLTKGLGGGTAAAPAAGFMTGGPTGGSDPTRVAGVVHEQEYVFSAASVRKIGARNLDALHRGSLRGFASGGFVGPGPMPAAPSSGGSASSGGNVTFAPSFDLRGANDPAEVERAARRGMQAALEDYDRQRLPGRLREALADRRAM